MDTKKPPTKIQYLNNFSDSVPIDPFLRWAGSKRKILPELAKFWRSDYRRYIEPFAGCAALFFKLQPTKAVLGDINAELIEVYKVVRENPDIFHDAISSLPIGKENYYYIRSKETSSLNVFNRAVRFVYLNRNCFNGIYRTNTKGHFNVPYGGPKPGIIPSIETFRKCSQLLQRAKLYTCDFGNILRKAKEGDFVYLDPPYNLKSHRIFNKYGTHEFTNADLIRLVDHLFLMDNRGVHFVLSYADSPYTRHLFNKWSVKRISVRRNIAGFSGARRIAYELIVTNITKKGN